MVVDIASAVAAVVSYFIQVVIDGPVYLHNQASWKQEKAFPNAQEGK